MYNPYYLPQQQVQKIAGEQSARSMRMAPNSSALFLDEREPIVWLCVSDGVGTVTPTAYDITPHIDKQQANIEDRLSRIENCLVELEKKYESSVNAVNGAKPTIPTNQTTVPTGAGLPKSAGYDRTDGTKQPTTETGYRNGRR